MKQRKQAEAALNDCRGDGPARFFKPPLKLLGLTPSEIERERARGVVVVPFWMETPSVARLRCMADEVAVLVPKPGRALVAGPRVETEKCQLLLAEVGLKGEAMEEAAKGGGVEVQAAKV